MGATLSTGAAAPKANPPSPSNPLPTANQYSIPIGPQAIMPSEGFDIATGKPLNPDAWKPSAPVSTANTVGEEKGQELADASTLEDTLGDNSIQVPTGLKVGDKFDHNGTTYVVSAPSFLDITNSIQNRVEFDKDSNPRLLKAVPSPASSVSEATPALDLPEQAAREGTPDIAYAGYVEGRTALTDVANFATALGAMVSNGLASALPGLHATPAADPQIPGMEVRPGYEPAAVAGHIIGGAAPFIAGGEVLAPFAETIENSNIVTRVVAKVLMNASLPALIEQVQPLQPGETRSSRFIQSLPSNLAFGLTSLLPSGVSSALVTGASQAGIGAYTGQDTTSNIVNAGVLTLFSLVGHAKPDGSYTDASFSSVKSKANHIAATDLGENADPLDVASKKAAIEFNKLSPADKKEFYDQATAALDYIAHAGDDHESKIKDTIETVKTGGPESLASKEAIVPNAPKNVADTLEQARVAAQARIGVGKAVEGEQVPKTTTYFRGGGEGSMPKGVTAKDIVGYEQKELGNKLSVMPGIDLSKVPSENVKWYTTTEKAAKEYGEVTKESVGDHRILARDSMGGVLVEKISREEAARKTQKKKNEFADMLKQKFGSENGIIFNPSEEHLKAMKKAGGVVEYNKENKIARIQKAIASEESQPSSKVREIIHSIIPEKDISLVFKPDLIDGVAKGKYSRPNDILNDQVKPLIELVENKGKVSVQGAIHEAGHYIFDKMLSGPEKRSILDAAHEEMSFIDKGKYRFKGYKGEDTIAQEYIMDEYAKQKAAELGFKGPLARALETIDTIVKRIYSVYQRAKEALSKIPGKEGGYLNFSGTDTDTMANEDQARMDEFAQGAEDHVAENTEDLKKKYLAKNDNVFNVDKMKDLIPGHRENPTFSEAFHRPAAELMGKMVNERLSEPGEGKRVVFLAGATASGKTTAVESLQEGKNRLADAHAVIDGTLASDRSLKEIKTALDHGYEVSVKYVENTPDRLFDNLVTRAQDEGDRTVPIETAFNSLLKSRQNLQRIAGKYADNPNFNVEVIDNSHEVPELVDNGVDFLKNHPYSKGDIARFKADAYEKLDTLYQDGKITQEVYNGLTRRKGDASEGAFSQGRAYSGEESSGERESQEGSQGRITARPDEAATTGSKTDQASFNSAANSSVDSPVYPHLDNMPLNQKTAERATALDQKADELGIRKDALDLNPAKSLAKYVNKRTGDLPTVTGGKEAKTEFAKRGDDIVTELGFKDPEEAQKAVAKFLADKAKFNEDVRAFIGEKKTLLDQFKKDAEMYGDETAHKAGDYDFEITENNGGVVPPEVRGGIQAPELDLHRWKDAAALRLGRDTMERNIEKLAPSGDADKAKKFLVDPVRKNELDRVNYTKELRTGIRAKMKEFGIRRGTSADEAVQLFGEGVMPRHDLVKNFPKKYKDIEAAAGYFRGLYDDLLNRWNEERQKFGYSMIGKRPDYFRHFNDINQFFNQYGFIRSDSQLPTEIAGLTSTFRPGKPFSTAEIRRTGNMTSYSAIGGIDNYLDSVTKQMYHIDSIQRGRALEKYIREVAKQDPFGSLKLSNFVHNLTEWTNLVAGKAHSLDRSIEGTAGRPVMKFLSGVSNLIARNIIVGNISVAMTHLVSMPLNLATVDKGPFMKGLFSTLTSPLSSEPIDMVDGVQSSFLARRFSDTKIEPTKWDKAQNALSYLFTAADKFKSKLTVESKYYEGLNNGLSKEEAMTAADKYAGRIIGDYSIGNRPTLLSAHATKLLAQFQLGVNDSLSVLMHDIPHWEEGNKLQIARRLIEFSIYSWAFNQIYKQMRGSGKGIDPIDAGATLMGLNEEGRGQDFLTRLGLAGKDLAGELPFSSIFTGTFPLASTVSQTVQDFQNKGIGQSLLDMGMMFSPTGGTVQLSKTVRGILAYNAGRTNTPSGQLKNEVDQTPTNLVKGAIFGPTAFEGAQSASTETGRLMDLLGKSQFGSVTKQAENAYTQMKGLDPAQANEAFNQLAQSNPALAKRIKAIAAEEKAGITQNDRLIKQLNVSQGQRAQYVYNKLMQLPDDKSRTDLWNSYQSKGIITPQVAEQLNKLIADKAPVGDAQPVTDSSGKPQYQDGTVSSSRGIIQTVATYAKAIGTDPVTAFQRIFSGQNIKSVDNGQIMVDRMPLSASQAYKASQNAANTSTKLDHAVPLEIGGDNSESNLQLIPTAVWAANTPVEDFLGKELKAGRMTGAQAREFAIRFKAGQNEPLSADLMKEYATKYKSSPLTAAQIFDYKNQGL